MHFLANQRSQIWGNIIWFHLNGERFVTATVLDHTVKETPVYLGAIHIMGR